MKEIFFYCRGPAEVNDALVYHEPPRKDGREEFFAMFQCLKGEPDSKLRELFREAISLSRLGHPEHYFAKLVSRFDELSDETDISRFEEDYRVVVGVRRGKELFLFRSTGAELVSWSENRKPGVGGWLYLDRERIALSEMGKQKDLFQKKVEDIFVLEKFTLSRRGTFVVVPSGEFFERNRERLADTIFFPDFDPSRITDTGFEWSSLSFCGVHWNEETEAKGGKFEAKGKRLKLSLPLVAGLVTAVVAFAIFFYPAREGDVERVGENRLLVAQDVASDGEETPGKTTGSEDVDAADRSATGMAVEDLSEMDKERKLGLELAWKMKFDKPVTSSPLVVGDRVFFGCRDGYLYCYDTDGKALWKYDSGAGIGASPAIFGNYVVCANYSGRIFALDSGNGEEFWSYNARGKIVSSPRIHGDMVLTGTVKGDFLALDARKGKLKWRKKLGMGVWASSCTGSDFVIVATMDGALVKMKYNGGIAWKVKLDKGILSSPLCIEEMDRVIFGCKDGYVYCYSIDEGKLLWRFNASAEVNGPPSYSEGTIVVGSSDGVLYAIDVNGKLKWKTPLGKPVLSKPFFQGGKVFVTGYASALYALDGANGEVLKKFATSSPVYSSCTIWKNKIFFGSNGGTFYALRVF